MLVDRHYRQSEGSDALKNIVQKCVEKQPESITSTKPREYAATVTQIANLNSHEVDWLARHLGHGITIHRDY